MAEALGTAAAIIQLAGVGLTLAKVLYKVSDEITSSAKQVKELASYVHSTSIVLEEVGKVFEEEGTAPQPIISPNAITTANEVIARCQTIFEKLHQVAEDARTNTFGAIILVLTSSRRLRLQTGLERSKSDLQLMMQIIIYARLKLQVWEPANETIMKKALQQLINENKAIREKYSQTQELEGQDGSISPREESLAHDDSIHATMAVQDIPSSYATQSTTGIASVSASATATNKPTQYHQQSPPSPQPDLDPNLNPIEKTSPQDSQHAPSNRQQDPHKDDISYWSALYLVCCPCKRKKLRRSAPKLPQEQYNWPVYPGKAPTSPYPVDYWRPTSPTAYSRAQAQHHAQLYPMETRASGPVYELPALNLDHSAQHGNPVYGGLEVNYHLGIEVRDVDALVGDWTTIYEIRGTD